MDECVFEDVLQELDDNYLPKLRDLYKDGHPHIHHIYNYLCTVIKWKAVQPKKQYFTILVPNCEWRGGTFIGINNFHCYDLIISSLEESKESLHNAIVKTKRIDWTQPWKIFAIPDQVFPSVMSALQKTPFDMIYNGSSNIWWVSKQKAVDFQIRCPDEVYISELKPFHSNYINQFWPPHYTGSERYIEVIIDLNGGFGVFLKSNDLLIAWSLRDTMGIGVLQTHSNFQNKGYGSLVSATLAKTIADAGYNPLGLVRQGNEASAAMFKKIGFEIAGTAHFIFNKEMRNLEQDACRDGSTIG